MAEPYFIFDRRQRTEPRPVRPYRPYLWGLAGWLKNGGMAVVLYVTWHAGTLGVTALTVFVSGLLLNRLLEATSAGD